jgi:hypothetical protein
MSGTDRRYFIALIKLIRQATQKCSAASEDWNRRNDEFNDWYKRQFPPRMIHSPVKEDWIPEDPVHYTDLKKKNIGLMDAEATWSHWEREVTRLTSALQAEVNIRQLLSGVEDAVG